MGEVIVITSGKGGVGKTTTTANLGCALAKTGKSVVLLDADIGLRNLDVVMGLENRIVYDFVDVIDGKCRLRQALIKDKRFENLYLLAASQTKDKSDVNVEQMKKLCRELSENYDFVLVDCPAGIEQGFRNAVAGADRAIVVATPEVSAVRDADRIIGKLEAYEMKKIQLLVNKVRMGMIKKGNMLGVDDVIEVLAIELLGVVPDDEKIIITTNKGEPASIEVKSSAGQAYRNTAQRILGEEVPLMDLNNDGSLKYKLKKIFVKRDNGGLGGVGAVQNL